MLKIAESSFISSLLQNLDRRQKHRRDVKKHGRLFMENFTESLHCEIRDESASGMKIVIEDDRKLPRSLALVDRKSGKLVDANLAWQQGEIAGLVFTSQATDVRELPGAGLRRLSILATRR
ncbi:hypothetical protein [uncultured Cohaesibacter sp.]|uniref:hypothetical protein n=1 Tax=uncultured Cohaesibacter sp. TaxID=1002546 RepID=UPI00292F5CAA|nr:hypothetical protein [uncultured Cohaesibacter sp.]